MTTAIVQATPQYNKLKELLSNVQVRERFEAMLDQNTASFMASLLNVVRQDNKLSECEPFSIINAAADAAALKLPVDKNLGFAWIIGYRDNKNHGGQMFAQFQMGYKGYVQLAHRTNMYETINVTPIYEGETIIEDRLTGKIRMGGKKSSEVVTGYAGYFKLKNGFEKYTYWPIEKLQAHGLHYSKTVDRSTGKFYDSSLWKTNPDAMYRKTVLLHLLKHWGWLSPDMNRVLRSEQDDIIEGEARDITQPDELPAGNPLDMLPGTTEAQPDPAQFAPDEQPGQQQLL